jgi:hypothetical protein
MRPTRFAPVVGLILLLASTQTSAQTAPTSDAATGHVASWAPPPESLARLTPTPEAEAPPFESVTLSALGATARVGRGGRREAVALMVVGAAGIVTGLIADEDILIIAGAGVGGFGLYLYLR